MNAGRVVVALDGRSRARRREGADIDFEELRRRELERYARPTPVEFAERVLEARRIERLRREEWRVRMGEPMMRELARIQTFAVEVEGAAEESLLKGGTSVGWYVDAASHGEAVDIVRREAPRAREVAPERFRVWDEGEYLERRRRGDPMPWWWESLDG